MIYGCLMSVIKLIFFLFNLQANMQWTEILSQNLGKEFYPQPLAGASASLWKKEDEEKKIIIFGGCTEISKYVTNLWIYDIGKL